VTTTSTGGDLLLPHLLIDGEWIDHSSGGTADHVNPATGKPQQTITMAGVDEVARAVESAQAALPEWRAWPPDQRRQALQRVGELTRKYAAEFVQIGVRESGIPISMASMLPTLSANWTEYVAGWADKLSGEVVPTTRSQIFDYTLPEPVGVVAVIMTWNGPIVSMGMCVSPALAAGCCVVLKPSELAPFSSTLFGRICLEAGIPPGVLNVIPGGADAGAALVSHPGIDKVSFTGGGATAKRIATSCASTLKPLLLELGGKSANLVFEDADLEQAATFMAFPMALAGQGCVIPSRLLIQESVYDEVIDLVSSRYRALQIGDPSEQSTQVGPVINGASCDRILGMVERAKDAKAGELLVGGERVGGALADGYYVAPTLFGNVDNASELAQEEVFGPVIAAMPFGDEEEGVALANDTRYGLAGYLHTTNLSRALRVAAALDVGNVGINGGAAVSNPAASFGGAKESGYGTEGGLGGVLEFVRKKNVQIKLG
jgi:aldehyde dehydrogenase (NAD+)